MTDKKRSNKTPTEAKTSHKRDDDFATPDGFNINAGRERGDGWIVKEEGNIVQGRLLGRQTYTSNRGKTRAFYQIQLQKPCQCEVENPDFNDEADEDDDNSSRLREKLGEGKIVNIDEFKKLEDLAKYTTDGGVYDVWFAIVGKVDIGDDQTMWQIQGPRLRVVTKPGSSPF